MLEHPGALAGGEAPEARGAVPAAGHRVVPVDGHGPHLHAARGTCHHHHNIHHHTLSVCPVRVCSREATLSPPSLVIDTVDIPGVDTAQYLQILPVYQHCGVPPPRHHQVALAVHTQHLPGVAAWCGGCKLHLIVTGQGTIFIIAIDISLLPRTCVSLEPSPLWAWPCRVSLCTVTLAPMVTTTREPTSRTWSQATNDDNHNEDTVQYSTVQYSTVQYSTVQYSMRRQ